VAKDLGARRLWQVFLRDTLIGRIECNFCVSNKTRLSLQLSDGTSLPIGLGSVWGREETRFVIPPDTPEVTDGDLETLHFLLAIVFRALIFQLDFSSS